MGNWQRTHDCGSLRSEDLGRDAVLMGWVNSRRDMGNLIFIDLRDREGLTQIVFDPQVDPDSHGRAGALRGEWVLAVRGTVAARQEGQVNSSLPTGEIELKVRDFKILNRAATPPFQIEGPLDASETLKFKYRYLELRRPRMLEAFRKRHRIAAGIRSYLDGANFVEVETPFLTKSTPEGARDYLVPSRVNKGLFYALPQSPQLFKQLLMVAGFDRYYQIVRCFRDEDLRADRQPEFTQVDMEMSFVNEQGVMAVVEGMMAAVFGDILGTTVSVPMQRMAYAEAMESYGADRPDLRFGMRLQNVTEPAGRSEFKVFKAAIEKGGAVKAIRVANGASLLSRKALDELEQLVKRHGAKGLVWIKVKEDGWQSPVARFFSNDLQSDLNKRLGARAGDLLLVAADRPDRVNACLGVLRVEVARRLNRIDEQQYSFVWITEFPLVERDEEAEKMVAVHHPFTSPLEADLGLLEKDPLKVRSRSYDLVLNGAEIGGGSIRIHNPDLQQRVFRTLGITPEEARQKFGFFLEALKYGAPPHGGIALGFDRLVALMTGLKSIREIIAFPKTTSATCPLTGAPSGVDKAQLEELGLRPDI